MLELCPAACFTAWRRRLHPNCCMQSVWCLRKALRDTAGKTAAPGHCEMHTGSSCLKQLQLLPWQTPFPPFPLGNRVSSDAHLPNLHPEKAKHWAARPHPRRGSGTRNGTDRRQSHCLDVVGRLFSFLSSEVEVQALCVYTTCSRNSVWTNVWVSALLSHNRRTGVGGRVNWCKQQLCSLSYHTWDVVWSVRKLVWILSVELWWVLDYSLSPNAHYFAKRVALQSERITNFPFLPLFTSWHWLALVFTDMGGLVASFPFTSSYF